MLIAKRPSAHRSAALGSVLLTILLAGCDLSSSKQDGSTAEAIIAEPVTAADYLQVAKRLEQQEDFRGAAAAIYKCLLQQPDNDEATLVAARVERSLGNLETAADIAASIDAQSSSSRAAVELHHQILMKLDRQESAAEVYLAALKSGHDVPQWRHTAWKLLNRFGRRAEACEQALSLARAGLATEHELISLVMRTYAFPTPGMLGEAEDTVHQFAGGLGQAKWYFTLAEYHRALEELAEEHQAGFPHPEADALYGRLLAETQQWDLFRQWSVATSQQAKEFGDYWVAMGIFFFSHGQHEAAVKTLLEAVRRDPTDRIAVQRLAQSLSALGKPELVEKFNQRAKQIYTTENESQVLYIAPLQHESRKKLVQALMALGRPFETLAWMLTMDFKDVRMSRQQIEDQRVALLSDPQAFDMAARKSLLDLDPAEFDMESAWQELLSDSPREQTGTAVAAREVLATPRLVNRAEQMGLVFQWYKDVEINLDMIPIHEAMGGGIAILDYDLDGWPDVYFGQGSGDPPTDRCTRSNQLFRGGPQVFTPVTSLAQTEDFNYSSGLAAGDVNQDGFIDLYLGSLGHNRLLINNGDGTFQGTDFEAADSIDRFTTSVAIADINDDELPDLFEANYILMQGGFAVPQPRADGVVLAPSPLSFTPESDRWFENLGDGRFRTHEITPEVAQPGTSLGVLITDFESDGKNEVLVAIDVRPNHLLVQSGENQFVNLADSRGVAVGFDGGSKGCMGIASGDINRDGQIDIQISNYMDEENNLYLQTSAGNFMDNSERFGLADVTRPYVGWGTKAVDIDRNGFLDLIVANGHVFDMRKFGEAFQMPPLMLMSDGRRFIPTEVDDDSGYWRGTYLGRTVASLDYDRDGSLDFLVSHLDRPVALLHNDTQTTGGWLQLEFVGTRSERDAIGAKVVVTVEGSQFANWVTAGDGYYCSDEPVETFGFESANAVARIEVHWPSGFLQTFQSVTCGHRYLIVEGEPEAHLRQ